MSNLADNYKKEVVPALMKNSITNQLCKFQSLKK